MTGGRPDLSQGIHTWITARMTYVFALAALQGRPGTDEIAAHGVSSLLGCLRDDEYGGWYASVSATYDGAPVDDTKQAYPHAFVVLAAGSAVVAEVPGARDLFDEHSIAVSRWFIDGDGRVIDSYDRPFAESCLNDHEHGSRHHELDARKRPSAQVWSGKPDVYHAYQATLLPQLPFAPKAGGEHASPQARQRVTTRPPASIL